MRGELGVIVQLGLAFFCTFSAFNSQGFIEIAVLKKLDEETHPFWISENSGYYSMAIIYLTFTLCNIIASPIIMMLGAKWAMFVGSLCYTAFMAGFLVINGPLLYFLSALLGFGAALLWTANGAYLVQASHKYNLARNSGLMWALLQSSLIAGAAFLYYQLHRQGNLLESYRLIYLVLTAAALCGSILLVFLPQSPKPEESEPEQPSPEEDRDRLVDNEEGQGTAEELTIIPNQRSFMQEFVNTFRLLQQWPIFLLSICFFYSGLEMCFFTGIYSLCLLSFTQLNQGSSVIVAYNALCMGMGQILGGFLFGVCFQKLPIKMTRVQVVILAFILHIIAFYLIFLNTPTDAVFHNTDAIGYIKPSMAMALIAGFLLGLADSCWNTQIYTLIGKGFRDDATGVFSLFKFFQSLAACIYFFYGTVISLTGQLAILCVSAFIAALAFIKTHYHAAMANVPDIE